MQTLSIGNPKRKKKQHCTLKGPKMQPGDLSYKFNRGLKEKHRRLQFKNLYSRLASLLPPLATQGKLPLPALVEKSLAHVKNLKERIDELKARKEKLKEELVVPAVEVNEKGPILEVNLVTGLSKGYALHEIISILEGEGAQVLSASYSTIKDRILYTISSQAYFPRIGIHTSGVYERLKTLLGTRFVSPTLEENCAPVAI